MDDSSTLDRRYSFNMAQCNPVAESTHLNGSRCSWDPISPKHRSYSNSFLNTSNSFASPKTRNVKIDARIAADVQSKGLVSRIVKYHETGTMLNRSMSAHNLYSKPGQFPAVTLKKTNLPYRATKQELSMIRIPPPEKSSFYGNTIASLLRSNSVVGLQSKRTEDLSTENRPIIHPPPTENDMAPTRSVLDVLKEISRKRINSDNSELEETSKKYCNRAANDSVDTGNTSAISQICIPSPLACQRHKRQRECITPRHVVQVSEVKTSPEQAKKRICNYNNDITSSLSSSIKCKRMIASQQKETMPINKDLYDTHKLKMQQHHDPNNIKINTQVDMRFQNLENNLGKVGTINPITPNLATALTQDQLNTGRADSKQAASSSIFNVNQKNADIIQTANKPRLTLFNKKCDDTESSELNELDDLSSKMSDEWNNMDGGAGITFVKPKKITSKRCLKNPLMERAQKSKLALMLSGLRGELYQDSDVDELDCSNREEKLGKNNDNTNNTSGITSALKSTSTITTVTTVTSSSDAVTTTASQPSNDITTVNVNNTTAQSSSASPNKTSPLVGLKVSHTNASSQNVASMLNTDVIKSKETPNTSNVSVLGGFSFGVANANPLINATTSKDCTTTMTTTNSSSNFSFGLPTQSISSLNSADKTSKLPLNMQPSTKSQVLSPTVSTILTSNPETSITATSSIAATKTFTLDSKTKTPSTSITSAPISDGSSFNDSAKLSNAFSFTAPSTTLSATPTQTKPITFGISASSTNANLTSLTAPTATQQSKNISSGATPPFTFNSTHKDPTSESPKISTDSGNPTVSFKIDKNTDTNSASIFGVNTSSTTKTQTPSSGFSFNAVEKSSNTTPLFNTQSFNTKATGESASIFGNVTSSNPENKILSSVNATPNLNSSLSTEDGTAPKMLGNISSNNNTSTLFGFGTKSNVSNVNKKSEELQASAMFGNNSVNTNSSATFNFGTQSAMSSSINKKPEELNAPTMFSSNSSNSNITPFSFATKPNVSTTNEKSENLVAKPIFGSSSSSNNTATPFSFGINSTFTPNSPTNNPSSAPGGFSFNSAILNSEKSGGAFAFGSKSGEQTNNLGNAFSGAPALTLQQKAFTFSSSTNKSDNAPSIFGGAVNKQAENSTSGFSFGSAGAMKSPPFTFGAAANPSGDSATGISNISTGFSFGAAANAKSNAAPTNKPFSFGSPQPPQPNVIQSGPTSNTNSINVFGLNGGTKTTQPPPFSFNSNTSTNLQSNTSATANNIFPPSNITTGAGERPVRQIRRATRRLHKLPSDGV